MSTTQELLAANERYDRLRVGVEALAESAEASPTGHISARSLRALLASA